MHMKNTCTYTNATFTTANGETVSFEEIFESIKRSVEFFGRTYGHSLTVEDLEDLIQDATLRALKAREQYDPQKASPKTWVNVIAWNTGRDALRARIKRDERYAELTEFIPGGCQADRDVEGNEAVNRILEAIGSLNENYQFILSLKMEGMKPRKMAELIGCTPAIASSLLCRARKALRNALGPRFLSEYGIAA